MDPQRCSLRLADLSKLKILEGWHSAIISKLSSIRVNIGSRWFSFPSSSFFFFLLLFKPGLFAFVTVFGFPVWLAWMFVVCSVTLSFASPSSLLSHPWVLLGCVLVCLTAFDT